MKLAKLVSGSVSVFWTVFWTKYRIPSWRSSPLDSIVTLADPQTSTNYITLATINGVPNDGKG